jgi:5-methylthioadenosine/S-adenosylhomocysteine deaminase
MSILIKNGTIVTMNSAREILNGDVLVEKDIISRVGDCSGVKADVIINAAGKMVIPGLIQTHVHLGQVLFRGMADDMELLDWLNQRIWPLENAHDEESLYYSSLLGCAELLRGGTTSIIDMATVRHTGAVFEAVAHAGIRYLGGKCMMDSGSENANLLREDMTVSIAESLDLLQKWNGSCGGRLRYAFCPRFVPSCSEELLIEVKKLSEMYGVPVHTHASENRAEIRLVEQQRGMRNITYLNHLGLCSQDLILAHCIHIDAEEQKILAESGVNVVHCPSSNLKLASGIAPIPKLLEQGSRVSLGADGAPCNNNLSMFMEMRLAALIHKPFNGPASMPAEAVFEMATLGGARAMGMLDQLGSLEAGKKADIVLIDMDRWHNLPLGATDAYARLVYQVQTQDVYCTLVDGKLVMMEGQLPGLDESALKHNIELARNRVCARAGI